MRLPEPRTPDPRSAPRLRWGILGTGYIAHAFVAALRAETDQDVYAVGSRTAESAASFGEEFGIGRRHEGYEALVADDGVDIVYVASPHSEHLAHARLALDAGKHVLVEKAFARNAIETRAILDFAAERGLFAQEAMWTRFLPGIDVVRQCLEEGLLGEVKAVFADHGQPLWPDGPRRLWDPALAGGALLDLGIYPMSFAHFVLGGFSHITATGALTAEGVDEWDDIHVTGRNGGHGHLHTTMAARTPTVASVIGTAGRLELGDPDDFLCRWYAPSRVRFIGRDEPNWASWEPDSRTHGLHFQAAEAARCIAEGRNESPLLPHAETIAIMTALDEVRAQLGMTYPGE